MCCLQTSFLNENLYLGDELLRIVPVKLQNSPLYLENMFRMAYMIFKIISLYFCYKCCICHSKRYIDIS